MIKYPVITFYGERRIRNEVDFTCFLCDRLIELINLGTREFIFGANDSFDILCARVVANLKKVHHLKLSSVLVVSPPMKVSPTNLYDQIVVLPEDVDKDEYIASKIDAIVTYVEHAYESNAPLLTHAKDKQFFLIPPA